MAYNLGGDAYALSRPPMQLQPAATRPGRRAMPKRKSAAARLQDARGRAHIDPPAQTTSVHASNMNRNAKFSTRNMRMNRRISEVGRHM